jgi:quinolinate synthase
LPYKEILFVPDQNLGHYISTKTKKHMILYPGFCLTHHRLGPEQVKLAKQLHPDALVVVHPECTPQVVALADAVLSTSQMLRYVRENPARSFLIGTEEGLLYRLRKDNPDKTFHILSPGMICPNMKRTTLETVATTMETMRNIIMVPEEIRLRAKHALDRMLAVA